jgi:hypothetical protein
MVGAALIGVSLAADLPFRKAPPAIDVMCFAHEFGSV